MAGTFAGLRVNLGPGELSDDFPGDEAPVVFQRTPLEDGNDFIARPGKVRFTVPGLPADHPDVLRPAELGGLPDPTRSGMMMKSISGGMLLQSRDNGYVADSDLKVVTKRAPTAQELVDCRFAWTVAKHVKSNAVVYAKDGATAGIGAGQMNRRDSARIAAIKAKEAAETYGWAQPRTVGSAVASDAFFPFADGLLAVAEAGATAVIQPGGSMRDDEVVAAADEAGLAMVFTGMRHFRH